MPKSEEYRLSGCYLLHFSGRLPGSQAQHYLGWSEDILRRVQEHALGEGAKITRAAIEAGLSLNLVRVWTPMDRTDERRLKGPKNWVRPLCPMCMGIEQAEENVSRRLSLPVRWRVRQSKLTKRRTT